MWKSINAYTVDLIKKDTLEYVNTLTVLPESECFDYQWAWNRANGWSDEDIEACDGYLAWSDADSSLEYYADAFEVPHSYENYDCIDGEYISFGINIDDKEEHIAIVYVFENHNVEVVPAIDSEDENEYFKPRCSELKALGLFLAHQEGFFTC